MGKEDKVLKNCFKQGAISAQFIGDSIAKHQSKTSIGAHQIFRSNQGRRNRWQRGKSD